MRLLMKGRKQGGRAGWCKSPRMKDLSGESQFSPVLDEEPRLGEYARSSGPPGQRCRRLYGLELKAGVGDGMRLVRNMERMR